MFPHLGTNLPAQWRVRLSGDTAGARFLRGSGWNLAGAVCSQGLRLAAFILVARFLGREVFGELGMLQNTMATAGTFAGLGLGLTATKYVAQYRRRQPEEAGRVIGLTTMVAVFSGLGFTLLVLAFADVLCEKTLNAPQLSGHLRLAAPLVAASTVAGAAVGILAGLEAFRRIAIVNIIQGVLTFPAVWAGVYFGGLDGAIAGQLVAATAGCVSGLWLVNKECASQRISVSYSMTPSQIRLLGSFSLPALLSGAMNVPVSWAGAAMLANQPNGYAELGVFHAANQWRLLIVFLPSILERSSLPVVTGLLAAGETGRYRRVLLMHLGLAGGSAILAAVPLALAAPMVMGLYGTEFIESWPVLVVLAAAAVLASANTVVGTVLSSRSEMWLALMLNSLWACVLLGTAWILAPAYGALGLAAAFLAAYAAHTFWQFAYWRWTETAPIGAEVAAVAAGEAGCES